MAHTRTNSFSNQVNGSGSKIQNQSFQTMGQTISISSTNNPQGPANGPSQPLKPTKFHQKQFMQTM
jgi:hypothetical protein